MSRIHDALKKAEQEKATRLGHENFAEGSDSAEAGLALGEGPPPVAAEGLATPPPVGDEEAYARQGSLDALLARCPQPPWNPNPKTTLFFDSQPHPVGTEEFRTLRSRLQLIREKQTLQKLLVTSPLPREGKTFIAANLAQVLVRQQGRRTLLIDADLRWSRLHVSLGTSSKPGLSDYLRGEADEFSVMQRGPQGNLFFIPGGKSVSNPAELITNGRLKPLLDRLTRFFDWIILDSPPAIPVSDARLLAEFCDGMLMVVQAGVTPFDMARKVRDQFRDKHLLGVVLNRVKLGSIYSSYYYGGYGNGAKTDKR